jgi:hypothetical protein
VPDHFKHAPESQEFQKYLNQFVKQKSRAHRLKRFQTFFVSLTTSSAE